MIELHAFQVDSQEENVEVSPDMGFWSNIAMQMQGSRCAAAA